LTWLRSEKRSDPAERRGGHGPSRRRAAVRPRLEVLEERRVLSTLTVTSNLDSNVFPGDGTLRGELEVAQSGDTIAFATGLQTIMLSGSQLEINKNLTIQGPGSSPLAISGGGARVFQVDAGANVAISGLTIGGGGGVAYFFTGPGSNDPAEYDGLGGGILDLGTVTLSGCNVTGNSNGSSLSSLGTGAGGFEGGGIGNLGTMTINNCNVTNNQDGSVSWSSPSYGGGVYNNGTMTITGGSVTGNSVYTRGYSYGGGVYNNGTLTLSGCNVTGNSAGLAGTNYSKGGGIFNDTNGQLTILSSTVQNNTASDGADICSLGSIKISKDSQVGKVSHK
jgi:hypothetical protein